MLKLKAHISKELRLKTSMLLHFFVYILKSSLSKDSIITFARKINVNFGREKKGSGQNNPLRVLKNSFKKAS